MKDNRYLENAFTLMELLVVLAMVSILGGLLLPALARTRVQSAASGCLSNFRQIMVGWCMYKDDNNDILMPGSKPGDTDGNVFGWYVDTIPNENWFTSVSNTNANLYTNGTLAPYINYHMELLRCPADVIPSENGQRVKARSMSSQIGAFDNLGDMNNNSNAVEYWKELAKGSDLIGLAPKDLFVFVDESFWTMNDGWLELDLIQPDFPDCFAAYHDGGAGISFADGHAEIHKWVGSYRASTTAPQGILGVPYQFGVQRASSTHVSSTGADPDWVWETQHASYRVY